MFAKLASLGYRGKILSILKSLYYNDGVWINVNGSLTEFVYFDIGVKQGCSLSPLLFAIYIDELVRELHQEGSGVGIGAEILSVATFADDILCLSIASKEGTERQLKIIMKWCKKWNMKLSESKTYISTLSGENNWRC